MHQTRNEEVSEERVGRLRFDYGDEQQVTDSQSGKDNLPTVLLAGALAFIVMIGALLLILSGVFAR